jgi:hypothetical protein
MADLELERLVAMLDTRMFGKFRGLVVDNVDPGGRGRLQVSVAAVLGEQAVWAMPCVPVANHDGSGFFAMPDIGSSVWVEFEAGNLDYPIWSGCFWPDDAIDSADAVPEVKFWKTRNFTIRIDDDAGELVIENNGGGKLTISASEIAAAADSVKQTAGGMKTALSQASFDVNDGAFTVV